jgi:hypothetical protein
MSISVEKKFYVHNGPALDSGQSLMEGLENNTISKESFEFHLERKDFVKWIEEVLENPSLAKSLAKIKTRKTYINKLRQTYL